MMLNIINKKSGFTLIELLVVIGILAVLVAIAVPAVAGLIDRANVSSDKTNASEMTNAIERFASEYELYCIDIASGAITSSTTEFDSAQSRVYQVTKVTNQDGIAGIEVDTNADVDEDIIQIFRDTKYPANAKTAKQIILVYTKNTGTSFMPKQSDMHFWYHPASGTVVYATPDSSVSDKNKLLLNGVDAHGDPLTDDEVWYDLSLDYTDEEMDTATFEYYSMLETAVNDANNDTIGANADADASNGKVALYKDNSGEVYAKLLGDVNVYEKIIIERNLTLLLDGKTLTATNVVNPANATVSTLFQTLKEAGVTFRVQGNGGSIVNIVNNGNRSICISNEVQNRLIVENTRFFVDASNNAAVQTYGISAQANNSNTETTMSLKNCTVDVRGTKDFAFAVAVFKNNKVEIENCNISAWATLESDYGVNGVHIDGRNSTAANRPVVNVRNCNISGANAGIQAQHAALTIEGGTYKGNHHGGVYAVGEGGKYLLKNANFEWTKMLYGYTTSGNSGFGNTSGAYFGDNFNPNTVVYIDGCNFTGYYYAFRLNGDNASHTAKVYISNSNASVQYATQPRNIYIDRYNELYIGKGNNFDKEWCGSVNGTIFEVPDGVYNSIP